MLFFLIIGRGIFTIDPALCFMKGIDIPEEVFMFRFLFLVAKSALIAFYSQLAGFRTEVEGHTQELFRVCKGDDELVGIGMCANNQLYTDMQVRKLIIIQLRQFMTDVAEYIERTIAVIICRDLNATCEIANIAAGRQYRRWSIKKLWLLFGCRLISVQVIVSKRCLCFRFWLRFSRSGRGLLLGFKGNGQFVAFQCIGRAEVADVYILCFRYKCTDVCILQHTE
ncbi:hypothetical protein D3C86_1205520 [compost metagenome]